MVNLFRTLEIKQGFAAIQEMYFFGEKKTESLLEQREDVYPEFSYSSCFLAWVLF